MSITDIEVSTYLDNLCCIAVLATLLSVAAPADAVWLSLRKIKNM